MSVPHTPQLHGWDCGFACAAALLAGAAGARGAAAAVADAGAAELAALHADPASPGTALWTVDLLLMLHARGIDATMTTVLAAVNPAHAAHAFYTEHDDFDRTAERVDAAFAAARAAGLPVIERSVPLDEVTAALSAARAVYVCLLDRRLVRCVRCGAGGAGARAAAAAATGGGGAGYQGHYIVLTGVAGDRSLVEAMDPAAREARCLLPARELDAARRAAGTDEDLIEVAWPPAEAGEGVPRAQRAPAASHATGGRGLLPARPPPPSASGGAASGGCTSS